MGVRTVNWKKVNVRSSGVCADVVEVNGGTWQKRDYLPLSIQFIEA
jgi:hypothetical protein